MEIEKGIKIDEPNIFVPWGISPPELMRLFNNHPVHKITEVYFVSSCSLFSGLKCELGFYFLGDPGTLNELCFFRKKYPNLRKSFEEFQMYLVRAFGLPNHTTQGHEDFNSYSWNKQGVQVYHYVIDRFGPEEHARIKKV